MLARLWEYLGVAPLSACCSPWPTHQKRRRGLSEERVLLRVWQGGTCWSLRKRPCWGGVIRHPLQPPAKEEPVRAVGTVEH